MGACVALCGDIAIIKITKIFLQGPQGPTPVYTKVCGRLRKPTFTRFATPYFLMCSAI